MLRQSVMRSWHLGASIEAWWLGLLLSAAALAVLIWILAGSDWTETAAILGQTDVGWLAMAVLIALCVPVAKTVRWRLLLGAEAPLSWLFSLVVRARLLNAVVPLRAGDVWRVVETARTPRLGAVRALGSVAIDKMFDGAAIACLGALVVGWAGYAPALAVLAALVVWVVVVRGRVRLPGRRLTRWAEEWTVWSGRLHGWPILVGALITTALGMALGLLANLAVLMALRFPVEVPTALAMLVAGYAAGAVPAVPGRFGVFEAAVAAPLVAMGVAGSEAVAVAIVLHTVVLADAALGALIGVALPAVARRAPPL